MQFYLVCFHGRVGFIEIAWWEILLCFPHMHNVSGAAGKGWRGALVKRSPEQEWVRIRSALLRVLDKFPDARAAVLQALVELRTVDEGEGG